MAAALTAHDPGVDAAPCTPWDHPGYGAGGVVGAGVVGAGVSGSGAGVAGRGTAASAAAAAAAQSARDSAAAAAAAAAAAIPMGSWGLSDWALPQWQPALQSTPEAMLSREDDREEEEEDVRDEVEDEEDGGGSGGGGDGGAAAGQAAEVVEQAEAVGMRAAAQGWLGSARQAIAAHGRAVQVDPIKPALKAPGTKRLELIYDGPLSNSRSISTCAATTWEPPQHVDASMRVGTPPRRLRRRGRG